MKMRDVMNLLESKYQLPAMLYHGTSSKNVESVLANGVQPGYWGTLANAQYFAKGTCHSLAEHDPNNDGGTPVVFAVSIYDFDHNYLLIDDNIIDFPIVSNPDAEISAWMDSDQTWQDCLRIWGAVFYDRRVLVSASDVV